MLVVSFIITATWEAALSAPPDVAGAVFAALLLNSFEDS
jgi:hypothetical protein